MTYQELTETLDRIAERLEIEAMGLKVINEELTRINASIDRIAKLTKEANQPE